MRPRHDDHPWLAADPTLDPWQETPDLDVVQTGAWILPDVRPLPDDLEAFLDAGTPPVYVGFGSMPMRTWTDAAQVAIEAVRGAQTRSENAFKVRLVERAVARALSIAGGLS